MQKPYPHQQKILDENPKKSILAYEMRTGKSLIGALWIDLPSQAGNTYIICMKQNKKDWQRFGTKATVLTKEEFKKVAKDIKNPTAIVVDELHFFGSALFLKKRSALATTLYTLVKTYPDMHFMGLTATPVRQEPWSLHTLLCYMGVYYDWKAWRNKFYEKRHPPFLRFPAWFPKDNWRIEIRPYLEKHCRILALKDIIKDLPPIDPQIIKIKQPPYKKPVDTPVTWTHEHLHEQQNKYKEILNLGYNKILVVVHYTAQIDEIAKELAKEKPVFILDGRTKDPDATKRLAQEAPECYFIVQSSMGMGFDGYMFGAMVFASMSHSCTNHTQMLGRLRHPEHLRSIPVYYLIGGRWDKRILSTIEEGKNFNPFIYLHE